MAQEPAEQESLCQQCAKIDFDAIFKQIIHHPGGIDLRIGNSSCPLCRFLAKMMTINPPFFYGGPEYCYLQAFSSYHIFARVDRKPLALRNDNVCRGCS